MTTKTEQAKKFIKQFIVDNNGTCPSRGAVASAVDASPSTAGYAYSHLERAGLVRLVTDAYGHNHYVLNAGTIALGQEWEAIC